VSKIYMTGALQPLPHTSSRRGALVQGKCTFDVRLYDGLKKATGFHLVLQKLFIITTFRFSCDFLSFSCPVVLPNLFIVTTFRFSCDFLSFSCPVVLPKLFIFTTFRFSCDFLSFSCPVVLPKLLIITTFRFSCDFLMFSCPVLYQSLNILHWPSLSKTLLKYKLNKILKHRLY
jgi:hypothetical protein